MKNYSRFLKKHHLKFLVLAYLGLNFFLLNRISNKLSSYAIDSRPDGEIIPSQGTDFLYQAQTGSGTILFGDKKEPEKSLVRLQKNGTFIEMVFVSQEQRQEANLFLSLIRSLSSLFGGRNTGRNPGSKPELVNQAKTIKINRAEIEKDTDLNYQVQDKSLKEEIVIHRPSEIKNYQFEIRLGGLFPKKDPENGLWYFYRTDNNRPMFFIPQSFMTDSNSERSEEIQIEIRKKRKGYLLKMEPDYQWLHDPKRAYPVIIDPTLSFIADSSTARYYIAPIVQIERGQRQIWASKVLEHIPSGVSTASIMSNPYKIWCLTWVEAEDSVHQAIQKDAEIKLIPFFNSNGDYLGLNASVSQLTTENRNKINTWLNAKAVPTDWITNSHNIGDVIGYTIRTLQVAQMLKNDYPGLDLQMAVGDIETAKYQRIKTWMEENNIDTGDFTPSSTVNRIIKRIIAQYKWESLPVLGKGNSITENGSISDNFDRADSTDLGANWSEDTGDWSILTNTLAFTNYLYRNDYYKVRWVGAPLSSSDNYVQATVNINATDIYNEPGPGVRLAVGTGDANSDGYGALPWYGGAFYLLRFDDSVETILGSWGVPAAQSYTIRIEAEGSTIRMKIDGTERASVTDATYSSGGIGCFYGAWSNADADDYIDNWEADDLVSPPTPTPTNTPAPGPFKFEGVKMEGVKID